MKSKMNHQITISVQPQLTIMTILMPVKDIVWGKMCLNPIQLMSSFIICFVLLLTEGLLNSFNYCAKTITLKANTLSESSQESKGKLTLSMSQQDNWGAYSKSCVLKSSMYPFSFLTLYLKWLKYPSNKINKYWWDRLSLRIFVKWKPFSLIRKILTKNPLRKINFKLFNKFTSKVLKLFFPISREMIKRHLLHWILNSSLSSWPIS